MAICLLTPPAEPIFPRLGSGHKRVTDRNDEQWPSTPDRAGGRGRLLAGAAPASAAAPPDLGELLECATYPSGDDICSGSVPSFDGAPLDVDLTLPRGGAAKKGLVVMLHGFGNDKHYWESNTDEGDGEDLHRWNTHWFARKATTR